MDSAKGDSVVSALTEPKPAAIAVEHVIRLPSRPLLRFLGPAEMAMKTNRFCDSRLVWPSAGGAYPRRPRIPARRLHKDVRE